jgi:hypothetical protein
MQTETQPKPEDFSVNERLNDYEVSFNVRGEVSLTIEATSLEDARAKAEDEMDDEEFGIELDEVTETRIGHVRKSQPMYRVLRDGKQMQVSRLLPGDTPRQPDERGF